MGRTQCQSQCNPAIKLSVTGLLLAGGAGRRMGGEDKGLLEIRGRPMGFWALERLRPQVESVLISANRNIQEWQQYGAPVVRDEVAGFLGPLAGIHAGLKSCTTPWLATVPCDSPLLPRDLVRRLATGVAATGASAAVVRSEGRLQSAFTLLRSGLLPSLERFLHGGDRKIGLWLEETQAVIVDFNNTVGFTNINTREELFRARQD